MKKYFVIAMLLLVVALYLTSKFIGEEGVSKKAFVAKPVAEQSLRITEQGDVIGFADDTETYAWLGIPFAAPPVGELRWRAPQPAQARAETLQSNAYNNACVQLWGPLSVEEGEEGDISGDEDCLYLNIWSPQAKATAGSDLPVMVWIHGGGNTIGTANTYPSNFLAGNENVVVVTINYRLGLFGWFTHPSLRAGADSIDGSGNYGTLDMIAALSWIKNNIRAFGGNPDNVTIFGESAGGRNVYSLMMSPLAKGLFHRAISQSGSLASTPIARAENFTDDAIPGMQMASGEWLLRQLIADGKAADRAEAKDKLSQMTLAETKAYLYSRTPQQMYKGIDGFAGMFEAPQTLRDGAVLPSGSKLNQLMSTGNYNSVPLMTGTNKDEAKLFMAQSPRYVKNFLGIFPRIKDLAAYNRASAYATDMWKASAVDEPARIISQNSSQPVFAYRWDWDEGAKSWAVDFTELMGAAHGLEVQYVFGNADSGSWIPGLYNDENSAGRDKLSVQMQSYWAEFARSGNPGKGSRGDQTEWTAWRNGQENLMLLDTDADGGLRMVNQPMTVEMLKARLTEDEYLDREQKCQYFAELFFHANDGDDYWDANQYNELGCEGDSPWQVRVPR